MGEQFRDPPLCLVLLVAAFGVVGEAADGAAAKRQIASVGPVPALHDLVEPAVLGELREHGVLERRVSVVGDHATTT